LVAIEAAVHLRAERRERLQLTALAATIDLRAALVASVQHRERITPLVERVVVHLVEQQRRRVAVDLAV
jgi:hypothetical protein